MPGGQQEREGPPAQLRAAKRAAGVRPPGQGGAWKGPPPSSVENTREVHVH